MTMAIPMTSVPPISSVIPIQPEAADATRLARVVPSRLAKLAAKKREGQAKKKLAAAVLKFPPGFRNPAIPFGEAIPALQPPAERNRPVPDPRGGLRDGGGTILLLPALPLPRGQLHEPVWASPRPPAARCRVPP